MNELHFLRSYCFLLLIPLAILLYALYKKKLSQGVWSRYCAPHLLPYIIKSTDTSSVFSLPLLAIFGILSITALAGPSWTTVALPVVQEESGLVIALNLSPAMYAQDIQPSRLQRALYKINDILKQRKEGQTALIAYTDEAFVVTPLTTDIKTISALLPALDPSIMPTKGIDHQKAVNKAQELLSQGGLSNGTILLITTEATTSTLTATAPVSILGVGTEQGAPIPKNDGGFQQDSKGGLIMSKLAVKELNAMAQATGGRYSSIAFDDSDIQSLSITGTKREVINETEGLTLSKTLDQGYWFILAALPFAVLLLRRGGYLTLFLICLTTHVQGVTWDDLWHNQEQQAEHAFYRGDYAKAAEMFTNPDWKAAALYKNGKFQAAAALYQYDTTPDGYYNYGNALAKLGKIDEAIQAYTQALELDPEHEDAAFNKKLLEEMKNQQQDQNQNNKDDQDKQQNQQDGNQDQEQKDGDKTEDDQENDSSDNSEQQKPDQNESDKEDPSQQPQNNEETNDDDKKEISQQIQDELDKDEEKEEKEKEVPPPPAGQEQEPDPQDELDNRTLERIPDDPGALLRRKFLYQYRNQKGPR